jgi:hypothetical protein
MDFSFNQNRRSDGHDVDSGSQSGFSGNAVHDPESPQTELPDFGCCASAPQSIFTMVPLALSSAIIQAENTNP